MYKKTEKIRKLQFIHQVLILLFFAFWVVACSQEQTSSEAHPTTLPAGRSVSPTITPADGEPAAWEIQAEHQEIFEIVWQTINETFFDSGFGGVDWEALHDEYLPRIIKADDDEAFYILINRMCFELGVSHLGVLPPGSNDLEPVLSATASVGIDLRLINDQAVITSVDPGSPADQAGLRTGYVILSVDGISVGDREALVNIEVPPYNERRRRGNLLNAIRTKFFGEPGQSISISYLDEVDKVLETTLVMEERTGQSFQGEGLPPMFIDFEVGYLEGGIAYIQFDGFLPPILDDVLNAIQDMRDAPAMIIDIRGNPGGFFPVRKAIASQFFPERTLLWRYATRPGLDMPGFETEAYTDPPSEAYLGPVVVLVDVLSGSSSEEFSGAMSANQRATVIGVRTSGSDLVAGIKTLPNGATFMYPIAQTRTSDGTILEDRGVIPDYEVQLDREDLLLGIDTQLEEAVIFLLDQ